MPLLRPKPAAAANPNVAKMAKSIMGLLSERAWPAGTTLKVDAAQASVVVTVPVHLGHDLHGGFTYALTGNDDDDLETIREQISGTFALLARSLVAHWASQLT